MCHVPLVLLHRRQHVASFDLLSGHRNSLLQKHLPDYSSNADSVIAFVSADQPIFRRLLVYNPALASRLDNFFYDPGSELRVALQRKYMYLRYWAICYRTTCTRIGELHHTLVPSRACRPKQMERRWDSGYMIS